MKKCDAAHIAIVQRRVDEQERALCAERDLTHTFVHVDMDAFYAAVEMRDNPRLAIGGEVVGHSVLLICIDAYR